MNLHDATQLARAIHGELSLMQCVNCEIVGAVHRQEPSVETVEILIVPGPGHPKLEFGVKPFASFLEYNLWQLEQEGKLVREDKAGEKLHKYHLDPSKWGVDLGPATLVKFLLYITTLDEWAHMLAFRNAPPPRNAHNKKGKPNG